MTASKQLNTAILMSIFLVGGTCDTARPNSSPEQKNLVATEKLSEWVPAERDLVYDATLTFLSDDTLVLQLCHPFPASNCPFLVVLQIYDGSFRTLARREASGRPASLFRTENGGILAVSYVSGSSQVFSTELTPMHQFPYSPSYISISGKTAAAYIPNNLWTVFRICAPLNCIGEVRRVSGELEAVSDDAVVIRDHDTIRVETMQGTLVSTFRVKPKSKCATALQIVSQGRLFLHSCGPDRMIDLNGKEITRFRPPDGWGLRRGWSADATRLLYDRYIRTVPALQRIGEVATALATLGAGAVDEKDNGEVVRVVDTTTGKSCFEWQDPKQLMDSGVYHADISPSGQVVALVTRGSLFVYRLPSSCAAKYRITVRRI